jgi:hypothetical protein
VGEFPARLWAKADLFTPMALRVAATLRLADHVADGAGTVAELARRCGASEDALGRVVDHLVAAGAFARDDGGGVSLGELGEELRAAGPWLDIEGAVGRGDLSALRLLESVRTGEPAYALLYGRGFWEDMAAEPELGRSYDALMGSRVELPEVVAGYDWSGLEHVVDVGGGNGALLAALLAAHPGLRGALVELPGAAEAARPVLAPFGDRGSILAGSTFEPLPAGADAYVVSAVLHAFDDERALAILRRCAEAARPGGRVLVIEQLLEDGAGSTEMNLRMLAFTGGRERTLGELERLAAGAGLQVGGVHRVARYRSLIELRP